MTTILANVQQFLDSDNTDRAREEVVTILNNLEAVDASIRDFAALLALGSQNAVEIGLGVLGRELLKKDLEYNIDAIWLLLAAVLSRQSITPDSPSRISILGLTSCVEDWELPIFALLTPALDSFFKVSLSEGSPLVAEQTLDFITTCGESYAKAPRTKKQLQEIKSLTLSVLNKVDDLELKEEWSEGLDIFLQIAREKQYSDQRIWSAAGDLLRKFYNPGILNPDTGSDEYSRVKDNILRLITSSLAALGTILGGDEGLSVAVRIDSPEENNSWSVVASAIDKLERLFQEIADVTFHRTTTLPTFTPAQAIPGSWTIILHISLNSNQSTLLAREIAFLSSTEYGENENSLSLADSWENCVARLKEDDIRVNIAVSTNAPELHVVRSISTEDIDTPRLEEPLQHNIRVLSRDIPQADSLERVLDFASLLIQYPSSLPTVRQKFLEISGITNRHFSYYRRSVEILGLADSRGRPTTACSVLKRLPKEAKMRFLAHQFISSNVGAAWFNWQNANDLSDIHPERAAEFLIEVSPSLSEATAKRRARTLESWLKIFLKYWG